MKLFTIGESVCQGFMSLAAAHTENCFSTLIAKQLKQKPKGNGHQWPEWPAGGHPANLETILRRLARKYGSDIRGLEWPFAAKTIGDALDEVEDYYERGEGRERAPHPNGVEYFYNVSVRGFDVADSWLVTPALCLQQIDISNKKNARDNFLGVPNASFYRTARRVLNPSGNPKYDDYSQLRWLEHHVENEGVDNLILWLGSNNALETVLSLTISQTPNDPKHRPAAMSHVERRAAKWNLWHPEDFEVEYEELLKKVDKRMRGGKNKDKNWLVFVGTVPAVTVAPLAKGVGPSFHVTRQIGGEARQYTYFKYYTYFPFEEDFARETGRHLTGQEAVHIDNLIHSYNASIRSVIGKLNDQHGTERYHLVDVATALDDLAWKRNDGFPRYEFPKYFEFAYPKVNTKYYHADSSGRLRQGGIFSLDGVHPTTIGQGLLAWEFLKSMKQAGVKVDPGSLNWEEIFRSDSLYSNPIPLMQEIYQHETLAKTILDLVASFQR